MARIDIFYLKKNPTKKIGGRFFCQNLLEFTHQGTTSSTYDFGK